MFKTDTSAKKTKKTAKHTTAASVLTEINSND
jgi:hypothetical protein